VATPSAAFTLACPYPTRRVRRAPRAAVAALLLAAACGDAARSAPRPRHDDGLERAGATWHDHVVTTRPEPAPDLSDLVRLRRARDRMDREYARPLDVEALARGAHMSAGHFSREFRRAYGESPYSYLMTRRIERAMALLRRGDMNVTEVCYAVGCASLGTFTTRFTELVGVSPGVYRREGERAIVGIPACVAKQVTRPIRNREAPPAEPPLE
jgi:AraC-like DNA-binding protein